MNAFSRLSALVVLGVLALATSASAQDYLKLIKPTQLWNDFEFSLSGGSEFSRDDEVTERDFDMTRVAASLSGTVYADKEFGIALDASYEMRDLDDATPLLPDELVSYSFGVRTSFKVGEFNRFYGILSASSSTDNEDVEAEDVTISLLASVSVPLDREWTLFPGLYFASTTDDGRTAPIPYPIIEAMYRPSEDFTLFFGLPANGFMWQANDWLGVSAFGFMLSSYNIKVQERTSETVTFDQFYRYGQSSWRLTDETVFPDDFTVNNRKHELGFGVTYSPEWDRGNGKMTKMSLRFEYAAQFGYKWEVRDNTLDLVGDPLRLEPGNVFRLSFAMSF